MKTINLQFQNANEVSYDDIKHVMCYDNLSLHASQSQIIKRLTIEQLEEIEYAISNNMDIEIKG